GYLAADDVGLGKSREIGGAAMDWLAKGKAKRIVITSKGENNLHDLVRELKLVAGVPEDGELPFKVVMLRDFPESAERGGRAVTKPLPVYDNAVYLVTSYELAPFRKELLALEPDGLIGDEVHTYKNVPSGEGETSKVAVKVGAAWKALNSYLL